MKSGARVSERTTAPRFILILPLHLFLVSRRAMSPAFRLAAAAPHSIAATQTAWILAFG